MEILINFKHTSKRLLLNDLNSVKNREDKSTLIIESLFPERFLSEEIAHPEEVKLLALCLSFDSNEGTRPNNCKCNRRYADNVCKNCFTWDSKYTNTLCAGITKFHNLETLIAVDLDLSTDLWIEFANNSKYLREIYFDSMRPGCKDSDNFCWWDNKEAALDALFHIPTLEKVYVGYRICMAYFPPGPSNIKYLYLHVECDEEDKEMSYEIYAKNLHTHTNIKTLILTKGNPNAYNILDLKLGQMQLEELNLENAYIEDIPTFLNSLPSSIKKIKFLWFNNIPIEKIINTLRVLEIEEIEIITNSTGADSADKYLNQMKDQLQEKLKVWKKFVFLDNNDKVFFDVLK